MPDTSLHFTHAADAEARQIVQQGLRAYNVEQIGGHAGYQDFELYARDTDGNVMGGMFGYSGMGWLYVDYLWLRPGERGAGLGGALLAEAEAEALRRGCVGLFLYTYDFQAPGFYRSQGYQDMGVLEDCPPGHQRFYLKKRLA